MTIAIAKNKSILKKRLMRYFDANSIAKKRLCDFLNQVSCDHDVLLFGGAIRDIALNGIRQFDSDLDFVFTGPKPALSESLNSFPHQENKFGGYRVQNNDFDIDIWPIHETWAFKQALVDYQSIASLLNTTITNWDAILFSWQNKKIIAIDNYFEQLNQGYLDIVLEKNPNELGLLVRILRHLILKEANIFSPRLALIVRQKLEQFSTGEIKDYEKQSYRSCYITQNLIDYLKIALSPNIKTNKNQATPASEPIVLDKFNHSLSLF